jgi:hypothetical protein
VLDPVLGDQGKLYVPAEVVPLYKSLLLPLADLVTPNQFEAETLSGVTIRTDQDALKVFDILHQFGPEYVVVTSVNLPLQMASDPPLKEDGQLGAYLLGSRRTRSKVIERFILPLAMVDGAFIVRTYNVDDRPIHRNGGFVCGIDASSFAVAWLPGGLRNGLGDAWSDTHQRCIIKRQEQYQESRAAAYSKQACFGIAAGPFVCATMDDELTV